MEVGNKGLGMKQLIDEIEIVMDNGRVEYYRFYKHIDDPLGHYSIIKRNEKGEYDEPVLTGDLGAVGERLSILFTFAESAVAVR